jgi:hypothetical protein
MDTFLHEASDLQFALFLIMLVTAVLILLQAALRRWVWTPYVVVFLAALVGLLVTLR